MKPLRILILSAMSAYLFGVVLSSGGANAYAEAMTKAPPNQDPGALGIDFTMISDSASDDYVARIRVIAPHDDGASGVLYTPGTWLYLHTQVSLDDGIVDLYPHLEFLRRQSFDLSTSSYSDQLRTSVSDFEGDPATFQRLYNAMNEEEDSFARHAQPLMLNETGFLPEATLHRYFSWNESQSNRWKKLEAEEGEDIDTSLIDLRALAQATILEQAASAGESLDEVWFESAEFLRLAPSLHVALQVIGFQDPEFDGNQEYGDEPGCCFGMGCTCCSPDCVEPVTRIEWPPNNPPALRLSTSFGNPYFWWDD